MLHTITTTIDTAMTSYYQLLLQLTAELHLILLYSIATSSCAKLTLMDAGSV